MIALVVGKALLDYLPQSLSGDAARYSLAGCAGLAAGAMVALVAIWVRRRTVEAADSKVLSGSRQSTAELFRMTQDALLSCRALVADPDVGTLVGWPHFAEEARAGVRPTAIGTAYGLKSCLLSGSADGRAEFAALTETLWRLQLPDKGWAARTQSGVGRPEVTALVLGVLSYLGSDPARLAEAAATFERTLTVENDPVGMSRTYVVSASLGGLARVAPASTRVAELRRMLIAGATRDPKHDNLLCWADQLADGQRSTLVPSIPHTARAIVALSRVARIHQLDEQAESTVREGMSWLIRQVALPRQTEQIRRTLSADRYESLTMRHFTSALVAKALMCPEAADLRDRDALLIEAVRQVWAAQNDGLWEWDNGEHPLWMTYQGVSALHGYALHTGQHPA